MRRTLVVVSLIAIGSASHAAPQPASPALALAALDRKIADLDAEEISSKRELEALSPQIKEAHGRALASGRAYYKLSRAGLLPVGGGFDALVTHAMRVERVRHALDENLDEEKKLRQRTQDVSKTLERALHDREALASQRNQMDAARLAMADEQRRQSAFEKAFESSNGGSDYVAVYGAQEQSSGFASMRGKLLFPVAGRADVRPGKRDGADGPGIEILAPNGTAVRAVYPGRVGFADRYGAYGRIVILDHGDHYYTVSGNLGGIDVKVGDEVSSGERIGSVGDDGQGSMLYFELRHGSQTIAPAPWLGL